MFHVRRSMDFLLASFPPAEAFESELLDIANDSESRVGRNDNDATGGVPEAETGEVNDHKASKASPKRTGKKSKAQKTITVTDVDDDELKDAEKQNEEKQGEEPMIKKQPSRLAKKIHAKKQDAVEGKDVDDDEAPKSKTRSGKAMAKEMSTRHKSDKVKPGNKRKNRFSKAPVKVTPKKGPSSKSGTKRAASEASNEAKAKRPKKMTIRHFAAVQAGREALVDTPDENLDKKDKDGNVIIKRTWPAGWKRRLVPRIKNPSRIDKYWYTPKLGLELRSLEQVMIFFDKFDEFNGDEMALLTEMGGTV